MDAAVIASMVKWPNVPDCYGWLHLDALGRWRLGEHSEGQTPSIVAHEGLKHFINRNYGAAENGCWALQNGPQRVWVTFALAPLIITLHAGTATAHTGQVVQLHSAFLADDGVVYFTTSAGPAALGSASMEAFSAGLIEHKAADGQEHWVWQSPAYKSAMPLQRCTADAVQGLLGFNQQPQQTPSAPISAVR